MKHKFILFLVSSLLSLAGFAASGPSQAADNLPTGRVILEVTGAIANTNDGEAMRFDREMLEALGTHEIVTETPWTNGMVTFTGVLASDVMRAVGATGSEVEAIAINDYSVRIPAADFDAHGVILALTKNGIPLTVRDRGPIWVIYPWSSKRELQNELYYSRSIWQLRAMTIVPE